MYMAAGKRPDGSLKSYMDYSPQELIEQSVLTIKQDIDLLSKNIVPLGFDHLKRIFQKRKMTVSEIDHFVPHLSSEYFRGKIAAKLEENDMAIPQEKWFTNLERVGNIGSASLYVAIDELLKSGRLKEGEKILFVVPESSRFSYVFGLFTVC